jgi:hypothetical protein
VSPCFDHRGLVMVTGTLRAAEERGIRTGEEALLSSALESLQQLNERTLSVLQRVALAPGADGSQYLASLAPYFRALDTRALANIARQPFLLVDFAFGKPKVLGDLMARDLPALRFPSPRGSLPSADAGALARGALLLAQTVCRHHPAHAGLLLGLDPLLHEPIARLRLPDLERIAEEESHLLRPRWENRLDVWRKLLSMDVATDSDARYQFRMYGMQLMAGDMSQNARNAR